MTVTFWLLLVSLLMYFEGMLFSLVISAVAKPPKWAWVFLLLLWPIALPVLGYTTYKKFAPIINEIRGNPILGALLTNNGGGLFQAPTGDLEL